MERTLIEQIEFYFSDINLVQDDFIQKIMDIDGMVPIETINTFKKIKQFNKTNDEIANLLKESTFLKVSEDNKMVGRKKPLHIYEIEKRIIKFKWMPCSLTEEEIFNELNKFGEVLEMKMKYITDTLTFKGSVEVLYLHEQTVERLLELDKVIIRGKEVIPKKWNSNCLWIKVYEGAEKIKDIRGIESEEDGTVLFEVPHGKQQKLEKKKYMKMEYISLEQYSKVLLQRKRKYNEQ